jgi:hypothetical protein
LRVSEQDRGGNGNRADRLRELIGSDGVISRAPTPGEVAALRAALDAMGFPQAGY